MKTTNKMDGDAFARELVHSVASSKDNHIIIAQDAVNLKDEAKQSAEAYWMMGWTWDEIESVLEDSEYPKNAITYALKETKEYARKVLTEGPFSVLKLGQVVRLLNGSVGVLSECFSDHIMVHVDGIGLTKISSDQLDVRATAKLREAYFLRVQAATMLYKLSTDQLDQLDQIPTESPITDSTLEAVDTALATIASIQHRSDEVTRDAATIHRKWEADAGKWEPQSDEEREFAQYLQVTLTGEHMLDAQIADLFHSKLGSALATLHDTLRKGAELTDVPTLDFVANTFPNIADKIEGRLYGITQRNVKAREYVQQFAKFSKEDGDWKRNAVYWAQGSWDNTKEFTDLWESLLVPRLENGVKLISEFLMNADTKQITASVQKALKTL